MSIQRSSIVVLLVLAACNGSSSSTSVSLVLETGTYDHARAATLDTTTGALSVAGADLADSDSVPVHFGDTNGILLRTNAQLAILAPDGITVARTIDLNDAGGMGANPNAVLSISANKAYVVRTGSNSILVIDPTKSGGDARLSTIDLSMFNLAGDVDGLVDAGANGGAILVGSRAYVALSRMYYDTTAMAEAFPGTSVVAVIDTATDTLVDVDSATAGVQAIGLEQHGPVALALLDGKLVVASSGAFGVADGGIELVDLATFSTRSIISEATLGGDLSQATVAGGRIVAVVNDVMTFSGKLVTIDATAGTVASTLVMTGAGALTATSASDVLVSVGPTVKLFDVATGMDETPPMTPASLDAMYTIVAGMAAR